MKELGVMANATIYCEIVEEDENAMNGIEEGFGGTALVGHEVDQVPCVQCTLFNPKGALACAACDMVSGIFVHALVLIAAICMNRETIHDRSEKLEAL